MTATTMADADLRDRLDDVAKEQQALAKAQQWQGDRLTRLEERIANHIQNEASDIEQIKNSIRNLEAVANRAGGAMWLTLRVGGALAVLATLYEALHIARII